MTGLLAVLLAIVVFGVVVLVHELGHFLAARRYGIQVDEFSIGFGPAIWKKRKNGTLYCIRLLPLGGYNLLSGQLEEEDGGLYGDWKPPARHAGAPQLPAVVQGRSFQDASPWQRFFVMVGGVLANFLLGFVLLVVVCATQSAYGSREIYDFLTEDARPQATGLQAGDEVLAINGHICFLPEDIVYELERTQNYTADLTVRRDGKVVELPDVEFTTATDADGNVSLVMDFRVVGVPRTPRTVVRQAAREWLYFSRLIFRSFVDLVSRQTQLTEISGPVGVVTAVKEAISYSWEDVFNLAAMISINLGIFNLLPIPALDGFKLWFLAFEGLTGRAIPLRVQAVFNGIGFVLLVGLMVFATMQDIGRLM